MTISIRPLTCTDSRAVAGLHLTYLRGRFTGRPGLELLNLYYKTLAYGVGAIGYVVEQEGYLVGYVCGVWDSRSLRRELVKANILPLVFWALCQAMLRPSAFKGLLSRKSQTRVNQELNGYELRPIIVSPSVRGTGAASLLVERLEQDAAQRGYNQIHLVTEIDNIPAQKFYQKVGFQLNDTIDRCGMQYLQYLRRLENKG